MIDRRVFVFALAGFSTSVGCKSHASTGGGGSTSGTTTASTTSSSTGTAGAGGGSDTSCLQAAGPPQKGSSNWVDGSAQAIVAVSDEASCTRSYTLTTTGPLRDGMPTNPRVYAEKTGQPVVRTQNDMFDALFALAIEEARQASVDSIEDGSFNGGMPVACPAGGCFQTGQEWTYVWTRDTSYSTELALAWLDPTRARNSMQFKLSAHRDGTRPEVVQDTGSGGSWPVSSDRVVWAMGASALLDILAGSDRTAFRDTAYTALSNTADRDRVVLFDAATGLYRGETSFLDWREQTYPAFTATDTVQIAMSETLSTNVVHLHALETLASIATEKGDMAGATKYGGWASALRTAIPARYWLADRHLLGSFLPTTLDPAPVNRFDLLGSALAVLSDAITPAQAEDVVASYPHFPKGAPVIFPEQQDTPIYHNRTMWPFVTSYWARAAAKVGNADALDAAVRSLVRGAALNLSNMENFEAVTGANYVSEGATSGPVVDSERQLWSVAGYLSMVDDVIFGREVSAQGIRFLPKLTSGLRASLFSGVDTISLSNVPYQGKSLSVRVHLPPASSGANGFLPVASET